MKCLQCKTELTVEDNDLHICRHCLDKRRRNLRLKKKLHILDRYADVLEEMAIDYHGQAGIAAPLNELLEIIAIERDGIQEKLAFETGWWQL